MTDYSFVGAIRPPDCFGKDPTMFVVWFAAAAAFVAAVIYLGQGVEIQEQPAGLLIAEY